LPRPYRVAGSPIVCWFLNSRRRGSPRRSVVDSRPAITMASPPDLPKLEAIARGMPAGTSAVTPAVAPTGGSAAGSGISLHFASAIGGPRGRNGTAGPAGGRFLSPSTSRRTDGIGGSKSWFGDASRDGRSGHGAVDAPRVVIGRRFSGNRGVPRGLYSRCPPPRFPRENAEEPQQMEVTASP